eukprot:8302848-Pyramimonas_sp.AAC.1
MFQPTQATKTNDEFVYRRNPHVTSVSPVHPVIHYPRSTEVADGKVRTRPSTHLDRVFRSCKDHGPREIWATRETCSAH